MQAQVLKPELSYLERPLMQDFYLGDRYSSNKSTRLNYSRGEDIFEPVLSQAVVFPNTNEEVSKIIGAFEFAKDAHEGQKRKSGHDFIVHPVEVATHLARLELDPTVIISGLLHDVIEDTKINAKDIQNEFGKEISEIVTALTKLTNDENNLIQNVDQKNMRRFLVSMAKDVRVIIIKLADRLHNVETLEYLDLDKRKKIAKETLSIHAPLAQKIGMNDLKWRLEDESFKHLMTDKFKMTKRLISQK